MFYSTLIELGNTSPVRQQSSNDVHSRKKTKNLFVTSSVDTKQSRR